MAFGVVHYVWKEVQNWLLVDCHYLAISEANVRHKSKVYLTKEKKEPLRARWEFKSKEVAKTTPIFKHKLIGDCEFNI